MKKIKKRACAAALSAALAFSFTAFTALGTAAYTSSTPAEIYSYELDAVLGGKYDEAVQKVYEALKNCDSTADVKGLGVTTSNAKDIYGGVLKIHPELFYASNSCNYNYYGDEVVSYTLSYSYDVSEIAAMKAEFNDRVNEITALVSEDMTDFEKAVVIHDELASSCTYDRNLEKADAYNALIGGEAVCQGYSYAYAYLLSLVGIQSEYAESDDMNHIWNKVCIDGNWYNVDVTWDDPTSAERGQAEHTYFLLSDSKISGGDLEKNHYNYTSVHTASSTKYDNALLHDIDTRLCFVSGSCYAVCNDDGDSYAKCLIKYNPTSDSAEVVKQFDYVWSAGGSYYYPDSYIALQVYDGLLYFNTPSSLCSYNVSTGKQSTVVENVLGSGASDSDACYGIVLKNDCLYAAIAQSPTAVSTESKLAKNLKTASDNPTKDEPTTDEPTASDIIIGTTAQITLSDGTSASVYYGDVNLDNNIDVSDATCVQKAVAKIITLDERQTAAADVNSDGTIDISDATYIQKYIAHII